MRLWIPKCGDAVELMEPWTFTLEPEYRNNDLYVAVTGEPKPARWNGSGKKVEVTLPVNACLVFDRIYIRQGADEFASVTFIIMENPENEALVGERFWVKLEDANKLNCTPTTVDNPVGGFAKAHYKSLIKERKDPALTVKKDAAKAAKLELEAVRDYVMSLCQPSNIFSITKHVDSIIEAAYKSDTSLYGNRRRLRSDMSYPRRNKRYGGESWQVVKTTKNIDGSTSRDLRFTHRGSRFGGFTITWGPTGLISTVLLP